LVQVQLVQVQLVQVQLVQVQLVSGDRGWWQIPEAIS